MAAALKTARTRLLRVFFRALAFGFPASGLRPSGLRFSAPFFSVSRLPPPRFSAPRDLALLSALDATHCAFQRRSPHVQARQRLPPAIFSRRGSPHSLHSLGFASHEPWLPQTLPSASFPPAFAFGVASAWAAPLRGAAASPGVPVEPPPIVTVWLAFASAPGAVAAAALSRARAAAPCAARTAAALFPVGAAFSPLFVALSFCGDPGRAVRNLAPQRQCGCRPRFPGRLPGREGSPLATAASAAERPLAALVSAWCARPRSRWRAVRRAVRLQGRLLGRNQRCPGFQRTGWKSLNCSHSG